MRLRLTLGDLAELACLSVFVGAVFIWAGLGAGAF